MTTQKTMATSTHGLTVRTISEDGMFISEDSDFSEDACYDWFNEVLRQAESGEIVQLIDSENNVLAEELAP